MRARTYSDPNDAFRNLCGEMGRWFQAFSSGQSRCFDPRWMMARYREAFGPVMHTYETDQAFVLEAEVPGYSADSLEVSVDDRVLTLKGERRGADQEAEAAGRGRFVRRVRVPDLANTENAEATLKDGVLKVSFPKSKGKTQARKIDIQS
jgi:HSP20 family protein